MHTRDLIILLMVGTIMTGAIMVTVRTEARRATALTMLTLTAMSVQQKRQTIHGATMMMLAETERAERHVMTQGAMGGRRDASAAATRESD